MSKILIEGGKVIIEGHASDLETCNTLTNLCDELSISDKFRTVKYESGYGEFESVSENEDKKFAQLFLSLYVYSNDGSVELARLEMLTNDDSLTVESDGITYRDSSSSSASRLYSYDGSKNFMGVSSITNATSAEFTVGSTYSMRDIRPESGQTIHLYIVESDPGYQVNIQSNDGTITLTQNAIVSSVVVTSTGAQLKCGDTVNATYTYAGSKLFAGLATSANATAPKYKPGDTIKITAATTFYIVENIIIPDHHSSLTELFTNIATVIREKTGDKASIVADDFPNVIRDRLEVDPPSQASLTPQTGIIYTDGLPSDWNIMKEIGMAISEASGSINANTTGTIYINKGNMWAYKITPGSTINVTSQIGTYTYAVMGFNNFALTNQGNYGGTHTTAGLTFGTVDCVGKYQMNSTNTNSGGWGACLMRTSTMPILQNGMPATLAQVRVPYVDYDNESVVLYSDDYMFLPAEKEVFGTRQNSTSAEANALTQFAYYKNGGSKIKSFSGSAIYWWLRSVFHDSDGHFCGVSEKGNVGISAATHTIGTAPCFCV